MIKKKGVTLIELLVVIVASAIILSTVMASFASLIKVTQKIDVSRQLQKEINFALIRIADKMRANSIDYASYEKGPCSSQSLDYSQKVCIRRSIFEKSGTFSQDENQYFTLLMNGEPLFSQKFNVRDIYIFNITPNNEDAEKFQPKLTVYLDVESIQYPDINFQIQTTLSSRIYQ